MRKVDEMRKLSAQYIKLCRVTRGKPYMTTLLDKKADLRFRLQQLVNELFRNGVI